MKPTIDEISKLASESYPGEPFGAQVYAYGRARYWGYSVLESIECELEAGKLAKQ